jgi:hypothetical protein
MKNAYRGRRKELQRMLTSWTSVKKELRKVVSVQGA